MNLKWAVLLVGGCLIVVAAVFYTQFSIFIVQPIGAVPEGKTLIIARLNKSVFIDSADSMCERLQGGVSLLCRASVLAAVVQKSEIYARLPYSEWLYLITTGGDKYNK